MLHSEQARMGQVLQAEFGAEMLAVAV